MPFGVFKKWASRERVDQEEPDQSKPNRSNDAEPVGKTDLDEADTIELSEEFQPDENIPKIDEGVLVISETTQVTSFQSMVIHDAGGEGDAKTEESVPQENEEPKIVPNDSDEPKEEESKEAATSPQQNGDVKEGDPAVVATVDDKEEEIDLSEQEMKIPGSLEIGEEPETDKEKSGCNCKCIIL